MVGYILKLALGISGGLVLDKAAKKVVREMDIDSLKNNPRGELERLAKLLGKDGLHGAESALTQLAQGAGLTQFAHPKDLVVEGYSPVELTVGKYLGRDAPPLTVLQVEQVKYLAGHIEDILPKQYVQSGRKKQTPEQSLGERLKADIIGYAEPESTALTGYLRENLGYLNSLIDKAMAGADAGEKLEVLRSRRDETENEIALIAGNAPAFGTAMEQWAGQWLAAKLGKSE